jgi:hypothetical protein
MGFLNKIFGSSGSSDDPSSRQRYDTGFITAYDAEDSGRAAFAVLKERAESFPNSRVELRVDRDYEAEIAEGYRFFPWLLIVFVKFEENFIDPNHMRRLLHGAPQPGEKGARQGAKLDSEVARTELLDAVDTPRADVQARVAARDSLPSTVPYDCGCGNEIHLPVGRVHHEDGVLMQCSKCGDNRLISPAIFDVVKGGKLPRGWTRLLVPPLEK